MEPYEVVVNKEYHLWKVATGDEFRPYTSAVLLTHDELGGAIAIVTNGFCIVTVPARWLGDREPVADVVIDVACLKAAKGKPMTIDLDAKTTRVGTVQWDMPDCVFPAWRAVIPAAPYTEPRRMPQLSPDLLYAVWEATGGAWRACPSEDARGPVIVYGEESMAFIQPKLVSAEPGELIGMTERLRLLSTPPVMASEAVSV